jgi:diguanylate cyclase (GGDEF)-like protein
MYYLGRITKPLEELTAAAEKVNSGNYEFTLEYDKDDEVGRLTKTFRNLSNHMKDHISDLNKRAYVDALTSVKNKGAFSGAVDELQAQIDGKDESLSFAIGIFDCNDLKLVNDRFGHDKGDLYLKTACGLICRIFQHSPVFRVGGDEFAVILQNIDYDNRSGLVQLFEETAKQVNMGTEYPWEKINVAFGIAEYDHDIDRSAQDVVRRADEYMYSNKRRQKQSANTV